MIASPLPAPTTPVKVPTAAHTAATPAQAGQAPDGGGFARLLDQALEEEPTTPPQAPGNDAAADHSRAARARSQRAGVPPRSGPASDAPPATPALAAGQSGEVAPELPGAGDRDAPADPDAAHEQTPIDPAALLASLAAAARPQPTPEAPAGKTGRSSGNPGEDPEDPPHNGPARPHLVRAAAGSAPSAEATGADIGPGAAVPGDAAARSAAAAPLSDRASAADQTVGSSRSFAAELQAALPAAAAPSTSAAAVDHSAPGAERAVQSQLAASPDSPAFAPELGAKLATFIRDGVHHARLELHPAQMGPLTVQIQLDGQAAQVHLAAQNADTRQALEQAMPQLAGSLREAGLTLSGGGVFEQPRQPQQDAPASGRGGGTDDPRDHDDQRGSQAQATPLSRRGVVDLVA